MSNALSQSPTLLRQHSHNSYKQCQLLLKQKTKHQILFVHSVDHWQLKGSLWKRGSGERTRGFEDFYSQHHHHPRLFQTAVHIKTKAKEHAKTYSEREKNTAENKIRLPHSNVCEPLNDLNIAWQQAMTSKQNVWVMLSSVSSWKTELY